MILYDTLRFPQPIDSQVAAYKDWLHLNLFDHDSGSVGLINVSLHGDPNDPRSRAVGAALVHVPKVGWLGNLEIQDLSKAGIGHTHIMLERVGLAIDETLGTVMASVKDPDNALIIRTTAEVASQPVQVEQMLPLGSGWISWRVVPRLNVKGTWMIGGEHKVLSSASAYHDHNWGRWFWGENFGWEWGCFHTSAIPSRRTHNKDPLKIAIVFAVTTDRIHCQFGQPSLIVYVAGRRQIFHGPAIKIAYSELLDPIERRIPGSMAALHQDHIKLHLPKKITIRANDGIDKFMLEFTGRSVVQLIMGDPIIRGYSFIHEIPGEFQCEGQLGTLKLSGTGFGVFEYVC